MEAQPGDLLLFVADQAGDRFESLARLRVLLAERLNLVDPNLLAFCWVIDFPFVNWNADEKRWDPSHHLFTSPMPEDIPLLDTDPGKARGQQYDLVLEQLRSRRRLHPNPRPPAAGKGIFSDRIGAGSCS